MDVIPLFFVTSSMCSLLSNSQTLFTSAFLSVVQALAQISVTRLIFCSFAWVLPSRSQVNEECALKVLANSTLFCLPFTIHGRNLYISSSLNSSTYPPLTTTAMTIPSHRLVLFLNYCFLRPSLSLNSILYNCIWSFWPFQPTGLLSTSFLFYLIKPRFRFLGLNSTNTLDAFTVLSRSC